MQMTDEYESTRSEEGGDELELSLVEIEDLVRACNVRMGRPLQPHDVDEVVQDTALAVWRQRSDFRGETAIEGWAYGIARMTIMNRLRARRSPVRQTVGLDEAPSEPSSEARGPATLADGSVERLVREGIRESGTTIAKIVQRHDVDHQPFARIASDLGMKETTVKARYYRGLPALRARLKRVWAGISPGGKNS